MWQLKILDSPKEIKLTEIEWMKYFQIILLYVLCNFLLHFLVNLLLGELLSYELKLETTLDEATSLKFILSACLLAPIVEELIFRLPLIVNRFNLIISVGFLIYFFSSKYLIGEVYEASMINLLAFILSFTIPVILFSSDRISSQIVNSIKSHYSLFFFTLLVSFGFLHILRYDNAPFYVYVFSPIIVLPYVFMSFVSSYFRLRYGLLFSILFHVINNLLPILILLTYRFAK